MDEQQPPEADAPVAVKRNWWRIVAKYTLGLPVALLGALAMAVLVLDSGIGHRLLADLLAQITFDNGLRVEIARIEGSVYGNAKMSGVVLRDPHGVFLRVPQVELDWRPLDWWKKGLDIRTLAVRRGVLARAPRFRDTGPANSHWPDHDLRIDRLSIERLTVAKAVVGSERRVDLNASARLSRASAFLAVNGRLGGGDRLDALIDIDKNRDAFRVKLDYAAPKGGLLAALTDSAVDRTAHVQGAGTWSAWDGTIASSQSGRRVAALTLSARKGTYALGGQVWTDPLLSPSLRAKLGRELTLKAQGSVNERMLAGTLHAQSEKVTIRAKGGVDMAGRAYRDLVLDIAGRGPIPLDAKNDLIDPRIHATLDGAAGELGVNWTLAATGLRLDDTMLAGVNARGTARRGGQGWRVPLDLAVARIVTDDEALNRELVRAKAAGILRWHDGQLLGDDLMIAIPHAQARFALRGRPVDGDVVIEGRLTARGWPVDGIGAANGAGPVRLVLPNGPGWSLVGRIAGQVPRMESAAAGRFAGEPIQFSAGVEAGPHHHLAISRGQITGGKITLGLTGLRGADGRMVVNGQGAHEQYGSLTFQAQWGGLAHLGPEARVHLTAPVPDAGLRDVTLALRQESAGVYLIDAAAQSALGPLVGQMALMDGGNGPARLAIRDMHVSDTALTGSLVLGDDGPLGDLAVAGGGVTGQVRLAPKGAGEGIDVALALKNARFAGVQTLTIGTGRVTASGLVVKNHTTIAGELSAQGIGKGRLFIGKLDARARLTDGVGRISATIGGRRGSRFDLTMSADVAPGRFGLIAGGTFAGQKITMPRRAVLTAERRPDGTTSGWRMAPSEIDYGGGRIIGEGVVGNGAVDLKLGLSDLPLSLGDVVFADLGLGGKASGSLTWHREREGLPTAETHLVIKGLTRSGLTLTSRPIDLAIAARLSEQALEARAVATEGGQARGRLQARIDQLGSTDDLSTRLSNGRLMGQIRYGGPADALWRLMALETFDLTGPVDIAADIGGTLSSPQIKGSLASDNLRLQSAQSGSDFTQIVARGNFSGSRLTLGRLEGRTAGGGTVVGSGAVDFDAMGPVAGGGTRGPALDLKLAASHAQFIERTDMALTATGPLRVVSDGLSGTIAGQLVIDKARWRLGQAAAAAGLPDIRTREINRRADIAPASVRDMPWRLVVNAEGRSGIRVAGLGLDSQWGANVRLRGALDNPAITGEASLISGTYEFAGRRFDLSRGRIAFDGEVPSDPRLDMVATASVSGVNASIAVRGTANRPSITFSSVPALPEEEVLARLLFGNSIAQISAPEAVQLGSALAALHGGGGMDPINKLRRAIGLDRLRIVSADASTGQQTGVAAGKYVTRRIFAELVTDGRGYSATNVEFRLTNWLALLGSVSTIGRQSVNARVSHDY